MVLSALLVVAALANNATVTVAASYRPPPICEASVESDDNEYDHESAEHHASESQSAAYAFLKKTVGDPVSLFTAVLAVVALLQGFFLILSYRMAKRSADAAISEARAHIFPAVDATEHNWGNAATPSGYWVKFRVANYGRTPAVLTKIEADAFVADIPPKGRKLTNRKGHFDAAVSGDGATTDQIIIPMALTEEQRRAVMRGEKKTNRGFLLASVYYEDVFGEPHETHFCLRWSHARGRFEIHPSKTLNRRK